MRFLFSSLIVLALTGCSDGFPQLQPFPTGYAYHQNEFKSQPGPPADEIGYPFSEERNAVVIEKWQSAAGSLVDKFESNMTFRPRAVYIEMLPEKNTFNTSLDYVLREEFRKRGYVLADTPDQATTLLPQAYLSEDKATLSKFTNLNSEMIEEPERARDFVISLTAFREGKPSMYVEGLYLLPAYGYVPGTGKIMDRPDIIMNAPTVEHVEQPGPQAVEVKEQTFFEADAPPESLVPTPVQEEVIQ